MSRPGGARHQAVIWPSRAAMAQARQTQAAQSPRGLLFSPPYFTFESLLPALLEQTPLPPDARPLVPLAGPLLVQELLTKQKDSLYAGLVQGRRLPERLWRLLVELKAGGLSPQQLSALAGPELPRLDALARLLEGYQDALSQRGLLDQADRLLLWEQALHQGDTGPLMATWQGVLCRQVLWLRPLDIRMLLALARVLPVEVEFAVSPQREDAFHLQRLIKVTANALEHGGGDMTITWTDPMSEAGPLASLALGHLGGADRSVKDLAGRVEFITAAGFYSEAEALVNKALRLVQDGVDPARVAIVLPELSLYGPMAQDVALRLGLPLDLSAREPLTAAPLSQALLALLELPLNGWERTALARVFSSSYLQKNLSRLAGLPHCGPLQGAGVLLAKAGYVDGREQLPSRWLQRAISGSSKPKESLRSLKMACQIVEALLQETQQAKDITEYCHGVIGLVDKLELNHIQPQPGSPASLASRDLAAGQGITRALGGLARAGEQAGGTAPATAGRLLALVREALEKTGIRLGPGSSWGVAVLTLADASGMELDYVLMGGLSQSGFPRRPQGSNLLSTEEMLALGSKAGLAVWRSQDEEYAGQVIRLLSIIGQVKESAVLSYAANDSTGRAQSPAFVLTDFSRRLGIKLPAPQGGVYGRLADLDKALEPLSLWGRLSSGLLRPGADADPLAQAVLYRLSRDAAMAHDWQELAGRARCEISRDDLNQLPDSQRAAQAGEFSGSLGASNGGGNEGGNGASNDGGKGAGRLAGLLAQAEYRRLSPSALETYAACPMVYFFKYILGLRETPPPGLELRRDQEGALVHQVLAKYFDPQSFKPGGNEAARSQRLTQCLDQAMDDAAGHPGLLAARRGSLQAALGLVVAREEEYLAGLSVQAVEREIGIKDEGLPVALAHGDPLSLVGRLDRLDQGPGKVQVTDYKHSNNKSRLGDATKPELAGETSFQLPVYMAAAWLELQPAPSANGRLVSTLLPQRKPGLLKFSADSPYLDPAPEIRAKCLAEDLPNLYNQIEALWFRLSSGDMVARPQSGSCGFCDFQHLCHAQPAAQGEDSP